MINNSSQHLFSTMVTWFCLFIVYVLILHNEWKRWISQIQNKIFDWLKKKTICVSTKRKPFCISAKNNLKFSSRVFLGVRIIQSSRRVDLTNQVFRSNKGSMFAKHFMLDHRHISLKIKLFIPSVMTIIRIRLRCSLKK